MKIVVVVESPSKAKTINKYLGPDYTVLASYGHIRDLPARNGSVDPSQNFLMNWELAARGQQQIKLIAAALKEADALYLATDPDREGEAISWHVKEVLNEKKLLKNKVVKRVVFHEINKAAILHAVANPRELSIGLIQAYLTRRALDYLVGFTLSPVLWRKLPGSRSAGRVQSVALRLICEREAEIEKFISQEYWSIEGTFDTQGQQSFQAKLTAVAEKKLEKFSITSRDQAEAIRQELIDLDYTITSIEKKQVKRHPTAPFITSTLQQEAHRKLRFGAKKTMQIAQQLYEGITLDGETVGLITYMRTDSTTISQDALTGVRAYIETVMGKPYLYETVRTFKSKSKNAQEAHEAIRPTQIDMTLAKLKSHLTPDQADLYNLIWQRTVASQMSSALFDQVIVHVASLDKQYQFRASGQTMIFDGFLKVYEEGQDTKADNPDSKLPPLTDGMPLDLSKAECLQHFTQPPPRFSEASLVKNLEEFGIGRPSTYASILSTLGDRKYIKIEKNTLIPEALGRLVTAFLENYFEKYVQYDFTAQLEDTLDDIANNNQDWHHTLQGFWTPFKEAIDSMSPLKLTAVIDQLNAQLSRFLFPGDQGRQCPLCTNGELSLKLGRFGSFIGCSNYPECKYTHKLSGNATSNEADETTLSTDATGKKAAASTTVTVGTDPVTAETITYRNGPYGPYFQWGEAVGKTKPKRVPVPKGMTLESLSLDQILILKSLPKILGTDLESNQEVSVGFGKFGPYLKFQGRFVSLKDSAQIFSIDLDQALTIIHNAPKARPRKTKD